jgi:hypothetical protein
MSLLDRAAYRVRQFARSVRPHVSKSEFEEASRILGPSLYPLFASMQAADQRHGLDVLQRLAADGCSDEEMLQAALIHDAGKGSIAGARIGLHHRVLFVLLRPLPGTIDALAKFSGGMRGMRDHDRRTIELAREYGAGDGVVRLLQAMNGDGRDERAQALIAADDRS